MGRGRWFRLYTPVVFMATAHVLRQICCSCAVHTQCCSTEQLLCTQPLPGITHVLQYSICYSLISQTCLSARKDTNMHILFPVSFLIAIIKLAKGHSGMTEMGLISAALRAGDSLCWEKDSRPDGCSPFLLHGEVEPLWASGMCSVPTRGNRTCHSKWDHWDQEIIQQCGWCISHIAWGFCSKIWTVITGEPRQIKEPIWAKINFFFFHPKLILTQIHLWIRFAVRLHKHFCWHRGGGRKEQAPGRDRKGNKGLWQSSWLLTTWYSWNYHVMWSCYVPRDQLNIEITKFSMTSCTCPSHTKTTDFFHLTDTRSVEVQLLEMSDGTKQKGGF